MKGCLFFFLLACAVPLSSASAAEQLPDWEDPPAVMEWIMTEPDWHVRRSLMESFFEQLPGEHFAECTDILWRNDGIQAGGGYGSILKLWAERHPESARLVAEQFIEIASDDHFSDMWEEQKRGPNPEFRDALKSSPIWPRPYEVKEMLRGFVGGSLSANNKSGEGVIALAERYEERFGEEVKLRRDHPVVKLTSPFFADVVTILACPLEEVHPMLKVRALDENVAARTFGWRRLAQHDPQAALLREECLRIEVIRVWAGIDAEGLFEKLDSLKSGHEESYATTCLLAAGDESIRKKVWATVVVRTDEKGYNEWADTLDLLMQAEPEVALTMLPQLKMEARYERYFRDQLLAFAFEGVPDSAEREVLRKMLLSHQPLIEDESAYILMEHWGDEDVGESARYAVTWHLASIKYAESLSEEDRPNWIYWDKEHLVSVWSGKKGPGDASMDDRAFGALRKWALCEPKEMEAWVNTLEDKEIREALHWLREHAAGGF